MYPDECRLEIPSRGIDAKLLVTTSNHILVNLADFEGTDEPDYDVWSSKRGRDSEETGTESDMTKGTEETIVDPEEVPAKRSRRGAPRKPRVPRKKPPPASFQLSPALQSELRKLQHAAARGSSGSAAEWARVSRAADKALALLLPDTGPRSMEISTIYTCQDTESECGTETGQCAVDNTHKCNRVVETEDDSYAKRLPSCFSLSAAALAARTFLFPVLLPSLPFSLPPILPPPYFPPFPPPKWHLGRARVRFFFFF